MSMTIIHNDNLIFHTDLKLVQSCQSFKLQARLLESIL